MNIILVQPPFTQLNSPAPGIYYLRSFLEGRGHSVCVRDHSIALFESVFCKNGLERVFADIRERLHSGGFERHDRLFAANVERFLTDESRWLSCIDRLVAFLRGQDREWGHLLALANGVLPEGIRFCRRIAEQYPDGNVPVDDAPLLASLLLADIADLIAQTLDPSFSLVRYVPSTAGAFPGFRDFAAVQAGLDGYIMKNCYRPLLQTEWEQIGAAVESGGGSGKLLLGVTIPFPGCLAGALVCADSARQRFGSKLVTVAGGGYVNTELRSIEETAFFDYFDYLSFDRGYGSLEAILANVGGGADALYKTAFRNGGGIVNNANNEPSAVDDTAARSVFPDYSGVDFSRYIRPVDDVNPMHRLWSDGRWLKAYAAHGCYWHNCAFCDVSLDYIRCYQPVDVDALFRHLLAQSAASGIRGVHLVDEACPPAALLRLALLNREAGLPLVFWGNIRFEAAFTPDVAAVLAAGGLIGVSAGLEVATESALARLGKGVDLQGVVSTCAAFKEAGILVHAYLIYGYWDEDAAEIIDSAETVRQLFAAGLLDSAFWHQFSLTVHSRVYAETVSGLHPTLRAERVFPAANEQGDAAPCGTKIFALNDISFEGENRFARFAAPLDRLLAQWMQGDTTAPTSGGFGFSVPAPRIAPEAAAALLDVYARSRDRERGLAPPETAARRTAFLGSRPLERVARRGAELWWRWRFADCTLRTDAAQARQCAALLGEAAAGTGMDAAAFFAGLQAIFADDAERVWASLRQQGLAAW